MRIPRLDRVSEEMLVSVCLHGMIEEYRIFLENLSLPSFAKLVEVARRTSLCKSSRSSASARPSQASIGRQM